MNRYKYSKALVYLSGLIAIFRYIFVIIHKIKEDRYESYSYPKDSDRSHDVDFF
jgi:hypothetical protein